MLIISQGVTIVGEQVRFRRYACTFYGKRRGKMSQVHLPGLKIFTEDPSGFVLKEIVTGT
jgi:hypothetical protein